jgi:PadR family transcriptional regulator, regulatory protein PadR
MATEHANSLLMEPVFQMGHSRIFATDWLKKMVSVAFVWCRRCLSRISRSTPQASFVARQSVSLFDNLQRHSKQVFFFPAEVSSDTLKRKSDKSPGRLDELVLLAILRLEPNAHGVAIQELIEIATKRRINVRELHSTLGILREKRWILVKTGGEALSGMKSMNHTRRYYEVSSVGRLALKWVIQTRSERNRSQESSLAVPEPALTPTLDTGATHKKEVIYATI